MRVLSLPCLALAIASMSPSSHAQEPPAWVVDSRAVAGQLAGSLVKELTRALADSPAAAIRVCSERAPAIAAEVSAATGATVGRTAAKVRNPDNAPTAWQQRGLDYLAAQLAAGAEPAALEYTETTVVDGRDVRRWMKPLMTAPLCLTCHGATLEPEVAAAVSERYPDDRATGFAAGDMRGAIYVVWNGGTQR
jgi:hypothetical protein